ncbi:MAG: hypothetical protein K8S23_15190 [Candidatus Cloacimonetes bacterium]|nr:hypothetical protein [Candidatus Cloacimonadota bacterium]
MSETKKIEQISKIFIADNSAKPINSYLKILKTYGDCSHLMPSFSIS